LSDKKTKSINLAEKNIMFENSLFKIQNIEHKTPKSVWFFNFSFLFCPFLFSND